MLLNESAALNKISLNRDPWKVRMCVDRLTDVLTKGWQEHNTVSLTAILLKSRD